MSITLKSILDNLDSVAILAGGIFAGTAFYLSYGQTLLDLHFLQ
jgi:hypothetical protein